MDDTSDRGGLVRAVLADPGDDLPRLVFADWLEENGEADRAGYIRAQVELARLVGRDDYGDDYFAAYLAVSAAPADALRDWVAADGLPVPAGDRLVGRDTVGEADWVRDVAADLAYRLRRGFVDAVRCRAGWWVVHGAAVAGRAGIERVEVTDRRPHQRLAREWVWGREGDARGGPHALPGGLFDRLASRTESVAVYRSRQAADDALSAACLSLAGAGGQ